MQLSKKGFLIYLLVVTVLIASLITPIESTSSPTAEETTGTAIVEVLEATAVAPTDIMRRKRRQKSGGKRKRSSRSKRSRGRRSKESVSATSQPAEKLLEEEAKPELPKPKRGKFDIQLNVNADDGIFWDSAVSVTLIPQFDRYPGYDSVLVRLTCRSDSMSSKVHWDTTQVIEVGDEVSFKFRPREPGFFWLQAEFYHDRKLLAFAYKKVGYQPQWFFPAFTPPSDIRQFWDKARSEVSVDASLVKLKPGPRHRWPSMQVFQVSIPSTDGVMIHGWLTVPKTAGLHPAILELPAYGNTMKPDLETRDVAVLRIDVRGHGSSRKVIDPGFPGFLTYGMPRPETYIYRGVVQDCLAGLRFLQGFERIDNKRIAVMGVSQGGGLASMVACLDSNVKAMAVSVPFMCNWSRNFETTFWPKRDFVKWVNEDNESRSVQQVLQTLSYFDPSNIAAGCKAKIFMAVGLQDMTCPPDGAFSWYNTMTQEKEVVVYKDGEHILPGVRGKMMSFLKTTLRAE